jgi:hypothetical protein
MKIGNKSFERAEQFKYLGTTLSAQIPHVEKLRANRTQGILAIILCRGGGVVNFATPKIWLLRARCSRIETFISTPGPLLMGINLGLMEKIYPF